MHCIGKKKPSRPSVDSDTQIKANNEQSADRHLGTQAEVPPTENQQFLASSSWSDDCAPVLPPTVPNEEASVSDSRIAHSEDDQPRAPTDPNQELCHSGQHKGQLAPLVAAIESPQCQQHADQMLELYCSSHEQPVCLLCASTSHRSCHDIETLDEAVEERSEELEEHIKTLKNKEDSLAWQRKQVEKKLNSLHLKPNPVAAKHDLLSEKASDRTTTVNRNSSPTQPITVQSQDRQQKWVEDQRIVEPSSLQPSCSAPASIIANASSPASAFNNVHLASQTSSVHKSLQNINTVTVPPGVQLSSDSQMSSSDRPAQTVIARTASPGSMQEQSPSAPQMSSWDRSQQGTVARTASRGGARHKSSPSQTSPIERPPQTTDQEYEPHSTVLSDKPYGADLANILQVGQRVKRCLDTVGWGLGTVTAVPSARIATRGGDPYGLVDVCWDAGGVGCYRMGRFGHYELELA